MAKDDLSGDINEVIEESKPTKIMHFMLTSFVKFSINQTNTKVKIGVAIY